MSKWLVEIDNQTIFTKYALKSVFESLDCEQGFHPKVTEDGTLVYKVEGPDWLDQVQDKPEGVVSISPSRF
jgi:hypothetical protein